MANKKKATLVIYVISTLLGAFSGYFGIDLTKASAFMSTGDTTSPSSTVIKQ